MSPTTPSPDSAEACYARGKKNFKDREYDAAIADFTKAIRLKPAFAEAYRDRGWSYSAKRQYDQAITDFSELIRLWPDSAEAYRDRGWAHSSNGQYDQAITDCSYALRHNERDEEAYYVRGMVYQKKGDNSAAIVDFTEAIRLKPDYADAYLDRGWSYSAKGRYDQAITDFTEAIRLKPDHADAYHLRGWAHLGKREYCEAVTDCTKASRLQPGCADALRKRIAIESARRSAQSRVATMTVREAEHLVFDIVMVALEDKSHRYAPVSSLRGFDLHQICVAQKLVIANQYLGLAHRDEFQEEFEDYTAAASAWLMSIQMHFVPDDQVDIVGAARAFDFDAPQFLSEETPNSFGKFCIEVGADDPLFWQKIHTRLGLEYNEKSPKRNIPITPDSELPDRDRASPEAGCALFLACFVLQGLGLVVWVFS